MIRPHLMKTFVILLAMTSTGPTVSAETSTHTETATMQSIDTQWDRLLSHYVSAPEPVTGLARFNYARFAKNTADRTVLTDYIATLESRDPNTMSDADAMAYWANLYNAVTVKLIIDNYPVSSIRKIKSGPFSMGPWGKKIITVNGKKLSLDNVEHDILRKQFPSPLIHYMVNCASVGCPNLKDSLWKAETLDADREAAARAFINSPRGVRITKKGLETSSIYKWFREDFGDSADGVIAHIRDYAETELAETIDNGTRLAGHDYDWSLNETKHD